MQFCKIKPFWKNLHNLYASFSCKSNLNLIKENHTSFSLLLQSPVVASSSSITTPASISSPVTTPTPLTEPVFGPSIPFIFSTTQIFRQTELPLNCDKCQFSCDPLREMQDHRKEKHRLWECRRCGDSYNNQQSFDEHDRGSRKCREHPYVTAYFPYVT